MKNLSEITRTLSDEVDQLTFSPPVSHVYNPLGYASAPHMRYLSRFGAGPKAVMLVGMNPGPFGMMQTGIPFGDVIMVRDFLGIEANVETPQKQHPKRPIQGFSCSRREISGSRLWGFIAEKFSKPELFFENFYVANYCPLVFLEEGGKNRTPDKLPIGERKKLYEVCAKALRDTALALEVRTVVGIGAFATQRSKQALKGLNIDVGTILHPSPASPAANRGWAKQAEAQLTRLGVL